MSKTLSTIKLYVCPVFFFLLVTWISRMYLKNFRKLNYQWIATVRIFISFNQILQILLMQADSLSLRAPNNLLKMMMDYLVSAQLPLYWLIDF